MIHTEKWYSIQQWHPLCSIRCH